MQVVAKFVTITAGTFPFAWSDVSLKVSCRYLSIHVADIEMGGRSRDLGPLCSYNGQLPGTLRKIGLRKSQNARAPISSRSTEYSPRAIFELPSQRH